MAIDGEMTAEQENSSIASTVPPRKSRTLIQSKIIFADKPVFKAHPDLWEKFKAAGIDSQKRFVTALMNVGYSESSANVNASGFLNLNESELAYKFLGKFGQRVKAALDLARANIQNTQLAADDSDLPPREDSPLLKRITEDGGDAGLVPVGEGGEVLSPDPINAPGTVDVPSSPPINPHREALSTEPNAPNTAKILLIPNGGGYDIPLGHLINSAGGVSASATPIANAEALRLLAILKGTSATPEVENSPGLTDVSPEIAALTGMPLSVAIKLTANGLQTRDDVADLASDELIEIVGENELTPAQAGEIIMAARAHRFDEPAIPDPVIPIKQPNTAPAAAIRVVDEVAARAVLDLGKKLPSKIGKPSDQAFREVARQIDKAVPAKLSAAYAARERSAATVVPLAARQTTTREPVVQEPLKTGPNFFAEYYTGHPSTTVINRDVTLTGYMIEAGLKSFDDFEAIRKTGNSVIRMTHGHLQAIRERLKQIRTADGNLNTIFRLGDFKAFNPKPSERLAEIPATAGQVRTLSDGDPMLLSTRRQQIMGLGRFEPARSETSAEPATNVFQLNSLNFASLDLARLNQKDLRALEVFVGKLVDTRRVKTAIDNRPVGELVDTASFAEQPVDDVLSPLHTQTRDSAERLTKQLRRLGILVARDNRHYRLSPGFLQRFPALVDKYLRKMALDA